jgi:MarR family transcriptional regulator, negative regulator of the multidrug operon emrRAB
MTIELTTLKQRLLMGRLANEFTPDVSPPTRVEALFDVLGLAQAIDERCARILGAAGLSEGRFAVLLLLEQGASLTPAELAEQLGVTRATVTGLIAGLERQGLVRREADPSDGRRARLDLTAAGSSAIREVLPVYSQWLGGAMHGVPAADVDTFAAVLAQMAENLTRDGGLR